MARPPKCKNCINFQRREDGSCWCEKVGHELYPENSAACGSAHFVRARVAMSKLSEIRRAASMSRKVFRGGRKPLQRENWEAPTATVRVRSVDHAYLRDIADRMNISISDAVHHVVSVAQEMEARDVQ